MENPAISECELDPLVVRRWSPRGFAERPVTIEVLRELLEAARWAASCMNEQPWRFLAALRPGPAFDRMVDCLVPGNQRWAAAAPALLLTFVHGSFAKNGRPNRHAWHDLGLAVGNLTVQALSRGLQIHSMAGIDLDHIRTSYTVPEGVEPVTAIAIGYPGEPDILPEDLAERERAPRSRRPLDEIAFMGEFGRPLRVG